MTRKFLFILLFSLSFFRHTSAQIYKDCPKLYPLFIKVEHPAQFNGSLTEYFRSHLNDDTYFRCIKLVRTVIDTNGKSCCAEIINNFSDLSSDKIRIAVNSMPGWTPAKQNGYIVNYICTIQLYI